MNDGPSAPSDNEMREAMRTPVERLWDALRLAVISQQAFYDVDFEADDLFERGLCAQAEDQTGERTSYVTETGWEFVRTVLAARPSPSKPTPEDRWADDEWHTDENGQVIGGAPPNFVFVAKSTAERLRGALQRIAAIETARSKDAATMRQTARAALSVQEEDDDA